MSPPAGCRPRSLSRGSAAPFATTTILALVGAGGMGEVYRARDTSSGGTSRSRCCPRRRRPGTTAALEREARMLAALNHPHIARLRPRGARRPAVPRDGARLRDGRSPAPARGPLRSTRRSSRRQIAEALEAAHDRGHRPSRPQAGQRQAHARRRVKVLDFGLAKALEPAMATPIAPVADVRRQR